MKLGLPNLFQTADTSMESLQTRLFAWATRMVAILSNELASAPRAKLYTVTYNVTAGAVFSFQHRLGRTPTTFLALPYGNAAVWATDADRALWTDSQVSLRCSRTPVKLDVWVMSQD